MVRIRIDRDSVAMGDDVDSHAAEWELPDDATIGDLVLRTIDEGYLASVGGPVGWMLEDARGIPLVLLQIDAPGGDRWVTMLGQQRPLAIVPDETLAFRWRYRSGGRRLAWDEFRAWVEETPQQAAERRRDAAREVARRNAERIRAHAEQRAAEEREGSGEPGSEPRG